MRLLARWYDDGEYWFFEDISGEHDPAYGAFEIDVPDEMARAYLDAVSTTARLADEIPVLAGLAIDGGTLVEICADFYSADALIPGFARDYRRCDRCGHYFDAHEVPV